MPGQSRCSSILVLMSSRGIPYHTHANITGSTPQYCQLIHRHDRLSEYQPSNDADTFCESSKFIAVIAIPYMINRARKLRAMNPLESGRNVPQPTPPKNSIPKNPVSSPPPTATTHTLLIP